MAGADHDALDARRYQFLDGTFDHRHSSELKESLGHGCRPTLEARTEPGA
jgi:hypothetical protein